MKDIMDYLKKNLGLEEEEGNDDQETIIVPEHSFYEIVLMKAHNLDEFDYALAQVLEEKKSHYHGHQYLGEKLHRRF
nr:hypothetical protein [Methanobacterium formicicum]